MSAADDPPLLTQRNFASLWWGQLISLLGDRLAYLALGGLLLEHTRGGTDARYTVLLAWLANVMVAPVLMFAPFTGAWVDRQNLKTVLVVSDLLRAGVVLAIPWAYGLGNRLEIPFALVFALFTCNVFFLPAKSAITPALVTPRQLLGANSLLAVAGIAATAAGALGGGWLVDHWGWRTALHINAVTYLVSVVSLVLIQYVPHPVPPRPAETVRHYLREVGEGWLLIRRSPRVALGLFTFGAVWMGGGFLHVAGNAHIQRAASVPGMGRVGVLLAALGLGSAISTWWVNVHGRDRSRARVLGTGFVLAGLTLVAFAVSTRFAVFAAAAFLTGLFIAPAFVLTETLMQEGAEPHQRGRVFSTRDFLMRLTFLIASSAAAALTAAYGTRPALLVTSALLAGAGVIALGWPDERRAALSAREGPNAG